MARPILPILAALWLAIYPPNLPHAQAESACVDRASTAQTLSDKYQEEPTGAGLHVGGIVLELYVSDKGNTWTIIVVYPDGCAALLATGEAWQSHTPVFGEQS